MPMAEYIKISLEGISFTDRMRDILWGIGEFFRDIRREVLWGWQRLFRGYDDTCEWALDEYINPIVLHHLRHLRARMDDDECIVSIPGCFCEKTDLDTAVAEWITVLDIMIEGFDMMLIEGVPDVSIGEEYIKVMKDRREKIDRALELFGKHYQSLWT